MKKNIISVTVAHPSLLDASVLEHIEGGLFNRKDEFVGKTTNSKFIKFNNNNVNHDDSFNDNSFALQLDNSGNFQKGPGPGQGIPTEQQPAAGAGAQQTPQKP